jgi:hypothetical protein
MSGIRAVGSHADRSLFRVQSLLDREFKGRLSFSLADSVPRKDGAGIDWYTETEEKLTRLTSLNPERAAIHRSRLYHDLERIRAAASGYEARKDAIWISTAAALRNAVSFPSEDYIWIVGDSAAPAAPLVITGWGYEGYTPPHGVSGIVGRMPTNAAIVQTPQTPQTPNEGTRGSDGAQATMPRGQVQPGRKGGPWNWPWLGLMLPLMLWLLAISLALTTALWLLPACGIRLPGGVEVYGFGQGTYCRQLKNVALGAVQIQNVALVAERETLKSMVKDRARTCTPPPQLSASNEAKNTAKEALERLGIEQHDDETTVTLIWHNKNDLDIQTRCPDGTIVNVLQPVCGGIVDHDDNGSGSGQSPLTDTPVEHLTWKTSAMMPGQYKILVNHFNIQSQQDDSDFTAILQQGTIYKEIKGTAKFKARKPVEVMQFEVQP